MRYLLKTILFLLIIVQMKDSLGGGTDPKKINKAPNNQCRSVFFSPFLNSRIDNLYNSQQNAFTVSFNDFRDQPRLENIPDKPKYFLGLSAKIENLYRFTPKPYQYREDQLYNSPEGVFTVGGINSHSTLQNMFSLTGVVHEILDRRAVGYIKGMPSPEKFFTGISAWSRSSLDGFIKPEDTIREVLIQDNIEVLDRMGLTHQEIAASILKPAFVLLKKRQKNLSINEDTFLNKSNGDMYSVKTTGSPGGTRFLIGLDKDPSNPTNKGVESGWNGVGLQGSFLNDMLFADNIFKFQNLRTGQTLTIDGLTPHLIYRYGFYQNGIYRVSPKEIVDFFSMHPPQ